MKKTGIELIAEERQRQITAEGWDAEHDSAHERGEIAMAAACYATLPDYRRVSKSFVGRPEFWPFDSSWWKPTPENRIRELQKAGALIAAEIDRLQKLNNPQSHE